MSRGSFDQLSPQGLAAFTAGLAGLPQEEIQKAKRLYLLDAITGYEAMQKSYAAFAVLQLLFAVIPCFWPILLVQWWMMTAGRNAARQRIDNALEVWRDDLGAEYDDFRDRLDAVSGPSWVSFMPIIGLAIFVALALLVFLFVWPGR